MLPPAAGKFQSVTICHRLTSLFDKPVFQDSPIVSGWLKVRLLSQDCGDIAGKPKYGLCTLHFVAGSWRTARVKSDDAVALISSPHAIRHDHGRKSRHS